MKTFTLITLSMNIILSNLVFAERTPVLQWEAIYDDPRMGDDYATDLAIDSSGNVYVAGYADPWNITTIKYDTNGNQIWLSTHYLNNLNSGYIVLKVDSSGYVYVSGTAWGSTNNYDYSTIKYDPDGNEIWIAQYNSDANRDDYARTLEIDNLGNVYVTGMSDGNETYWDYATVKYDSNGNEIWVRRFHNPQENYGQEVATDIAVDQIGNIYVTGCSSDRYHNPFLDDENSVTIKYDSNGNQLWEGRWKGCPIAMALDDSANVYVTGVDSFIIDFFHSYGEFVTVKYDTNGHLLWADSYEDPNRTHTSNPTALALDNSGNVYITGSRDHNDWANKDYLTIKYDNYGNLQWAALFDSDITGDDIAQDIAIDNVGNVYITGSVPYGDYLTIKYSSGGDTLWTANYDYPAKDFESPRVIAVDDFGNIYITGYTGVSSYGYFDYATIKYTQHDYCFESLAGDYNGDCKVEFTDFSILAEAWLNEYDLLDLGTLAEDWLNCNFALEADCW